MSLHRIRTDATVPALCTRATHDAMKINADTFAAGTTFRGVWADGTLCADCRQCGSSLHADPAEWDDAPTDPVRMACARPITTTPEEIPT